MIHPIIVSTSQFTQHKKFKQKLDPVSLIVKTSKHAIESTNVDNIERYIDGIYTININSWSYYDAPGLIAEKLGITPKKKIYLSDGGNTPQMLVNRTCQEIQNGEFRMVLICGAEAFYSKSKIKDEKILNWPQYKEPRYMEGEIWNGINEFENRYGLKYPPYTYAIFETALRAKLKRNLDEHNKQLGLLFEKFSKVASENPYSWTKRRFNCKEIIDIEKDNRLISHPYTKRMCANLYVDQAASILITSEKFAQKLNLDSSLWVNVMAGVDLNNIYETTRRPHLYDSPATREASNIALKQANLTIDDITGFDIYSCFPSIVQIIRNELGIDEKDPRQLTLTGGLPYFGGPWSNYSLHAIVTAVKSICKDNSQILMVVANGGYNSKQSVGIYGKKKPKITWNDLNLDDIQQEIYSKKLKEPIEKGNGKLVINGYTITYDRKGNPEKGIILGSLKNGSRTLAFLIENLTKYEKIELVGRSAEIRYNKELKRNVVSSIDHL